MIRKRKRSGPLKKVVSCHMIEAENVQKMISYLNNIPRLRKVRNQNFASFLHGWKKESFAHVMSLIIVARKAPYQLGPSIPFPAHNIFL